MDKLKLAHEFAMKIIGIGATNKTSEIIRLGWEYADAMQAEADKREDKTRPEVLLTKDNDGKCLHLHHEFDHKKCMDCGASLKEWQPDWSQAPEWAKWWAMDGFNEKANWYIDKPYLDDDSEVESEWNIDLRASAKTYIHASSFDYQGNWKESLRKRPQ